MVEDYHHIAGKESPFTPAEVDFLAAVVHKYPYFQAARAQYLKGLKQQDSWAYNDELRCTAAFTTDRSVLFEYIIGEEFQQLKAKQVYHETTVTQSEVTQQQKEQATATSANEPVIQPQFDQTVADEPTSDPADESIAHAPFAFDRNEQHSFAQWLQLTKIKPLSALDDRSQAATDPIEITGTIVVPEEDEDAAIKSAPALSAQSPLDEKLDRIERFLQERPKIAPPVDGTHRENLAKASLTPTDALMTETLARVYVAQNQYAKAIQAYKILGLRNPEKSSLFADRIREVELLRKSNQTN